MITRVAGSAAVTAIVLSLGAFGAPTASAGTSQATPTDGSIGICFTIPMPGSADLYWCL
ncbi:hypothetical protein NS506_07586 [Nocardia seriolae]|uniref:Uncharacterized protein n=1 Tax=Nocardia seriolae TaxID=37332 RepID=A0ABC8B5T7_9NOCA|nr:hypothetical protein NS506_07586 [Nocardia seriolae]